MYGIETGKTETERYWPDEGQETCSSNNQCTAKGYTWSKSTDATKIGLMYIHDIDYAYTYGNPNSYTNVKNSWIHFQKDGYNTSPEYEQLTTRFGVSSTFGSYIRPRCVDKYGRLYCDRSLDSGLAIRPVFYLSSKAKIVDGDGTKTNPYILDVQE